MDEPLIEFPEEPVYPPVPVPYASLAHDELAAFGVGVHCAPPSGSNNDGDDDDEEADDEELDDDE
jgi:hypothetical protein